MSKKKPQEAKKELSKPIAPETVRERLKKFKVDIHPKSLLEESAKLWTEYAQANDARKEEMLDELNEKLAHASVIVELENHYMAAETVDNKKLRTLMIEVIDSLIVEHDCKTTTEKMLAETAGAAFCRMIEYSNRLTGLTRQEYLTPTKTGHYSMLSKEVDRCTRQYISALTTLKRLKQPALNITFKSNNAYVAQNQQINTDPKKTIVEDGNVGQ